MSELQTKMEAELDLYYASPDSIMQVSLDVLEEAFNGTLDIVDASSPFMFLLEASATNANSAILQGESLSRKMYPLLSQDYKDLYNHMADSDYLDRFAAPMRTKITVVVPVKTLTTVAVLDPVTNVRRITLPKDSGFLVGGFSWYIHRPVDIVILANGIIQVAYDLTVKSPLVESNTNLLDYRIVNNSGVEELLIELPVEQLNINSTTTPVSPSTGFAVTESFPDSFYYVRAYHSNDGVNWAEMYVTHTDQVFDISKPTLVVQVLEAEVKMHLPDICMSNGNVGRSIRTEVFTTRGQVDISLGDYSSADFKGKWQDLANPTNPYITPLSLITDMVIFADHPVVGGRDELSLEDLRERVIYRSADSRASITFEELTFKMNDLGYFLNKAKDTITERLYICSKVLPDTSTYTPGSSTVISVVHGRVIVDAGQLDMGFSIRDNGLRKTLNTEALFMDNSGDVSLLSDSAALIITAAADADKPALMNSKNYLYTPFFYVLDRSDGLYVSRVYYLDAPTCPSRNFIQSNEKLPYSIDTNTITVTRQGNIYTVVVVVNGYSGVTGMHAQLVFTDASGIPYRLVADQTYRDDKTFTVIFTLDTTFDINGDNQMEVTNMVGPSGHATSVFIPLTSVFDLVYYRDDTVAQSSLMDHHIVVVPGHTVSVTTHEQCTLTLGVPLDNLYTRARAIIRAPTYVRLEEPVYLTYTVDKYDRDAEGNLLWVVDPTTQKPIFTLLETAGEFVYDGSGERIIQRAVGDVMVDAAGLPVVSSEERLIWEISPVLLDARFKVATSAGAVAYRRSIPQTIMTYLQTDIASTLPTLMARTELAFQPVASSGAVSVLVDGKQTLIMETALTFNVNYLLTPRAMADAALRNKITVATKTIIRNLLQSQTLAMGELTQELMQDGGDAVISVNVDNPIGGYDVAVIQGANANFSIRSELNYQSNGLLEIADSVYVSFSVG